MARKCAVCMHPERQRIEEALVAGQPLRDIAGRFGVYTSSLGRHKLAHLPELLSKSEEAKEELRGGAIFREIRELKKKAEHLTKMAEEEGDLRAALKGIRELTRLAELQSRLIGDLQDQPTVNLLVNPQWITLRSAILGALDPFPEIKTKLAEAMNNVSR